MHIARQPWNDEVKRAKDEYVRAHEALDREMPRTQSSLPVEFEPLDPERLNRIDELKRAEEEAWRRFRQLLAKPPE